MYKKYKRSEKERVNVIKKLSLVKEIKSKYMKKMVQRSKRKQEK